MRGREKENTLSISRTVSDFNEAHHSEEEKEQVNSTEIGERNIHFNRTLIRPHTHTHPPPHTATASLYPHRERNLDRNRSSNRNKERGRGKERMMIFSSTSSSLASSPSAAIHSSSSSSSPSAVTPCFLTYFDKNYPSERRKEHQQLMKTLKREEMELVYKLR